MPTAVRMAGYAIALALVFGSAWGVGRVVGGPVVEPGLAGPGLAGPGGPEPATAPGRVSRGALDPAAEPSLGLASTQAGYSIVPLTTMFAAGQPAELAFRIIGPDGAPVTAYGTAPDVVVVRRDLVGFRHLYPDLGPDGVWRAPLTLPEGGVWRANAGVHPTGGPPLVLGTDLFASGEFVPVDPPASRVAQVDDYQVRLDGALTPGDPTPVVATVRRDGAAVTDLEPDRGAFGHLVGLREGDLAFVRVRPAVGGARASPERSGPGIAFTAAVPSAGVYRLFLEFRHTGTVHTAAFTVATSEGS